MADLRGRRAPGSSARLNAILGLSLLVGIALGVRWLEQREPVVAAGPSGEQDSLEADRGTPGGAELSRGRAARAADSEAISGRSAEPDAVLARQIETHIANAVQQAVSLGKGRVRSDEVSVAISIDGPQGVVRRLADRPFRPASNLKLFTTAAALVLLGAEWEFETRVDAGGELREGILEGDLIVRAGGDPLYPPDGSGQVEPRLDDLARRLRASGLRHVAGDLVLDQGPYADPAPGPGWPPANQHWADYCALAAGLTLNAGTLVAHVEPTRSGSPASLAVHPSPHGLPERYGVDTVSGTKYDLRVGATRQAVTVRGSVGERLGARQASFSHPDPVGLFGSVLRQSLAAAGISVDGAVVRRRRAPAGPTLASLRTPWIETLVPIHAESVNPVADQVFLATAHALGLTPTRAGGQRATERALERLGVPTAGLVQVDGSGLSRENRITAHQMTALLDAVLQLPPEARRVFLASLAVSGESGTLEGRMKAGPARGRVRAKTGWIAGASAIADYADTAGGELAVFSILVDYPADADGLNTRVWKPMQDAILESLVAGPQR